MSYNLVNPTTGDLTRVAGNSNIVDTAIETTSTWSSSKIYSAINSIGFKGDAPENANSATTPGVYLINRNDDAYPVRQGYLIVSKPKQDYNCILQEVYYFNANMIYSRGCWFNSWYDWQQLVTNDSIFLVGDRRNTIGWADLSKVNIDGSSNFANNVGRIEGHNAIIEVSNPSVGYQWPVTNSGDNNAFVDFGGAIQFFTDKVNNHLYVRFADSSDMSAWGELATMDKLGGCSIIKGTTTLITNQSGAMNLAHGGNFDHCTVSIQPTTNKPYFFSYCPLNKNSTYIIVTDWKGEIVTNTEIEFDWVVIGW